MYDEVRKITGQGWGKEMRLIAKCFVGHCQSCLLLKRDSKSLEHFGQRSDIIFFSFLLDHSGCGMVNRLSKSWAEAKRRVRRVLQ